MPFARVRQSLDQLAHTLATGPLLFAGVVVLCLGRGETAHAGDYVSPPRRLEYRVSWNGIPAAHATIRISTDDFAGDKGYVIQASARTNAFVDLFWRFRARAHTTFVAAGVTPLEFTYENDAGGTVEVAWIDFDLPRQRARGVYIKKGRRREFDLPSTGLLDPVSAAFRAMASGAHPGERRSYHVFTGRTHYRIDLLVEAEDVITTPAGRFEALRIVPETWKLGRSQRRDKRLRSAKLWVARDPPRTLLRVRSKVFVGSVTLDLVSITKESTTPIPAAGETATPAMPARPSPTGTMPGGH